MARWRLINAHYLNILDPDSGEPTQWEYKEQDRLTGKMGRKIYNVPDLLDPKDPNKCNYPGEVIVCHLDKGERKDIVFFGDPTPEMEPLDEEAEQISVALQSKWAHPINDLPTQGASFNDDTMRMMAEFAKQIGAATQVQAAPQAGPSAEEFAAMKAQLEEMRAILATHQPSSPLPASRRA